MDCETCKLNTTCLHPNIPPEGDIERGRVLFVGEAPGQEEDVSNRPFIGESGQLLRKAILANKLTQYVIVNTVRCRPQKNATPTIKQIRACFPQTLELIGNMPHLSLIVPIGNIALRAFIGKQGITSLSGKELEWEGYKLMPIIHPASILYDHRNLQVFNEHMAHIPAILDSNLIKKDYGRYQKINTIKEWQVFYQRLNSSIYFIYDLETTGLNPFEENQRIKLITFSIEEREAYALSLDGWSEDEWAIIYHNLKTVFENPEVGKIGHNIKYDNLWMRALLDIEVQSTIGDTCLSQYTLFPNMSADLKDMAWEYTGLGGYEVILGDDEAQDAEGEKLETYSCIDSDITHRIYSIHKNLFYEEPVLESAYKNLLVPVSNVLCKMEYNGIRINPPRLHFAGAKIKQAIAKAMADIMSHKTVKKYEKTKEIEFNPNSHKQLTEIFYGEKYENLEPIVFTKKKRAPATSQDVLKLYKDNSTLANLFYVYSRYLAAEKIFKEVVSNLTLDHLIHTNFWITSTRSGRSSSRDPNLQNIPKGAKDMTGIRKAFIAHPNYYLVECDFNQHELRCMADEAEDDNLRKALNGDVHLATTASVLGISPEEVTEEQRSRIGKVLNFSIIYGKTSFGLAKTLNCSEQEGQRYLDRYFLQYPNVKKWIDYTIEYVKEHGYVWIRSGFKKYFPSTEGLTDHEIRAAVNVPIQGLAGHILFYALIGVDKFLVANKLKSFLSLEIHDSIVLNVHKTELSILPELTHIMTVFFKKYIDFSTPLKVDVKIGYNWGDMEKYNV